MEKRAPGGPNAAVSYNFEPDAAELLGKLLPYYVHLLVYEKILESRASEHSARMVAMKERHRQCQAARQRSDPGI